MNDTVNFKGHVNAILFDERGTIKQSIDVDNLVVTIGKQWIIDRIGSNTPATSSHIAIGSSATPAAASDTALGSFVAIKNGTVSQPTATQHQVVTTFLAGEGTATIQEYGLYASGSALIGHLVTGSITKLAADSLQVTYTLSVS